MIFSADPPSSSSTTGHHRLPQLSAISVTISRRYMLEQAIKRIRATMHAFELTDDDDATLMASVKIDLQPHSKSILPTQQVFFGESTQFASDAVESACSAALSYLLTTGIITIDDYNSADLNNCQRQLKAEQFWSSELYDRVESFQKQLSSLTTTKKRPSSESNDDSTPTAKCVNKSEDGLNDTPGSLPPNKETSTNETDHSSSKEIISQPVARRALLFKD
ncbi:uncharacterized protein [Aegilops tauschii subsp. strangulata]|uniref:uncharacterized protein isoform X2 n=1 Tax=Aegilops tauschii subsp. strangulata TaxID=200361 RepID=UPI001ABBF15D|nr:uncharacterized protein LOC120964372 isoform X2 [Aegilops tauschii subsp. strangulata]